MNARFIIHTIVLLGLVLVALSAIGCNTWDGAGKDVERTGEVMQGE